MKTLKDVQEFINSIPDINSGGCGVAALAMYRWLKKNDMLKKTTMFHFLHSYDGYLYETNKRYVEKNEGKPSACSHIGLIHGNRTIDCEGFINTREYKYKIRTSNENMLVLAVNNVNDWNSMFDRKHVKTIAKKLDIDMSDVNTNNHEWIYLYYNADSKEGKNV